MVPGRTKKAVDMRKTIHASGFLTALLLTGNVWSLDLLDIYHEAQINDTRYASAKAQYLAVQERLPQAKAGLRPNVSFEAGWNYNDVDVEYDSPTFNSGQRNYTAYNYGIRASQPDSHTASPGRCGGCIR